MTGGPPPPNALTSTAYLLPPIVACAVYIIRMRVQRELAQTEGAMQLG
jgi:hypothetical protein